jgi:sporulation protein YlmC with PRC-barrel domain
MRVGRAARTVAFDSHRKETIMQLYTIRRRNGWATAEDLQAAAARSTAEGDKAGSGVRWIRSYVLTEENGDLGTLCVYEADSPEAIRTHAHRVGMPADEITTVADTVIVRPDPVAVAS